MDFKQIQELIKMVSKSNIGEVTIEQKDFRVTVKQKEEHITQVMSSAMTYTPPVSSVGPVPSVAASLPANSAVPSKSEASAKIPVAENTITIKSPMIGTFYRRSSPDKPPFVETGTSISPGQVVCVIEAMKLFNEIESEVKGKIVKILVEDSSPVEYDQPLFMVEPA